MLVTGKKSIRSLNNQQGGVRHPTILEEYRAGFKYPLLLANKVSRELCVRAATPICILTRRMGTRRFAPAS